MASHAINEPFSSLGASARTKLVMLGDPDSRWDRARSFPIEHVSFGADRKMSGENLVRVARKWFFHRTPDAGFVLTDFPATLLQAKIFDEWLDARHEALDAVVAGSGAPEPVVAHYAALGLLSP